MPLKNKKLAAVMSCVLMLAAAPLLPAGLSVMGTAYAKEGGGHGGGNGGGNGGGGSGGGNGGGSGGGAHGGEGHSAGAKSNGRAEGQESDHDGRAVRDHGLSGKHIGRDRDDHLGRDRDDHLGRDRDDHVGRDRDDHRGHGAVTSGIAHSKATRGVTKATAISATTPGDHNAKGLSKAVTSTTDKIR
ncbi:hypothetical protein [Pseudomonas brassicacearum]|uniref:hypothetical protein n=1 Tax=Pseudomonas brassicacearum TaxID=930166 RepID=UPI00223B6B3B|nr:hypothetical protein [Pseudomonas brassicacearum]